MVFNGKKMGVRSFGMKIFEDFLSLVRLILRQFGKKMGANVVMEVVVEMVVRVAT